VLVEASGVPVGIAVDGANRNDMKLVRETLESIPVERPEPTPKQPQGMCMDKGYDYDEVRGMYSTASFIHAAGKTVTVEGEIVPLESAGVSAVYEFMPIDVHCDEHGITAWQKARGPTDRCIFHIRDVDKYPTAMASALKSTLLELS